MLRRAEETVRRAEREAKEKQVRPGARRPLVREQVRLARLEAPRVRPGGGSPPEVVQVGESYWAEVLGREVEVVREPDDADRVMVVQGGVRVELPRTALRMLETASAKAETSRTARTATRRPEVGEAPLEIDLRGLRVEESLEKLDRALDRALLAGLRELRVIHGKGTGALREAVQEYCRSHAAVCSAELADQWEGGTGATVIRLEA
jgi:DNA mismatch repair protein MutS2